MIDGEPYQRWQMTTIEDERTANDDDKTSQQQAQSQSQSQPTVFKIDLTGYKTEYLYVSYLV